MDVMEIPCIVNYVDVSCCNKQPQVSIAYQGPKWIFSVGQLSWEILFQAVKSVSLFHLSAP